MAINQTLKSIDKIKVYEKRLNEEIFGDFEYVILALDSENIVSAFINLDRCDLRELIIINDRLREKEFPIISYIYECNDVFYKLVEGNISFSETSLGGSESENVLLMTQAELRIRELLSEGVLQGASDIHIIRKKNLTTINMRKQGNIYTVSQVHPNDCDMMMSVLYNVNASGKGIAWNRREPQDAVIAMELSGIQYTFRYAHMPIHSLDGESYHVVLRVLGGKSNTTNLDIDVQNYTNVIATLGFDDSQLNTLKKMFSRPNGLIVICGTTGSGKSTTIKSMLEWLYNDFHKKKISMLTVEDPVEYDIEGAIQTSVVRTLNSEKNAFMPAIYSAMRRDPDVLLIGETRDPHTASALVDIVEGGHIAVTTLHASSVVGAMQRLSSLGISLKKQSAVDFWSGSICQKLIRITCPTCSIDLDEIKSGKVPDVVNRIETSDEFQEPKRLRFAKEDGCEKCNYSGSISRQVVAEMLFIDDEILSALVSEDSLALFNAWVKSNSYDEALGKTLRAKALELVKEGKLCPFEFESKFGFIE